MTHRPAIHALCLLLFSTPLVALAGGSGCGGQISGADAGGGSGSGSGSGGATCASACNQLPLGCGGSVTQSQCLSSCEQAQGQCTAVGYGQDFASLLACIAGTKFVCQGGQAQPSASSAAAYNQCIAQASTWEPACSGSMIMPSPAPTPTTMPGGGPPPPPGPPSCATVCTRIQQQCGSEPMCASQCVIEQKQCAGQGEEALFQDLLDCVLSAPLMCGSAGSATPVGCDSEAQAVQSACGIGAQDGGAMVVDASSGRD